MFLASHLWYGGSFPFVGQLCQYGEDMRCARDAFLCRPPSLFSLFALREVQSTPVSGVSCFYYWTKREPNSFLLLKKSSHYKPKPAKMRLQKGTCMLEGGKKKFPSIFVSCHYIVACHVWWHVTCCCTGFSCEMPAFHSSKTAKLPLVSMWHEDLVNFGTDGAAAGRPTLFLQPCHHTGNRVQGLSSYTLLLHTPFLVSTWLSFWLPICFYRILVTGAAERTRCRTAAAKTHPHIAPFAAANSVLLMWAIGLKSKKGAQPTSLKRNLLSPPLISCIWKLSSQGAAGLYSQEGGNSVA